MQVAEPGNTVLLWERRIQASKSNTWNHPANQHRRHYLACPCGALNKIEKIDRRQQQVFESCPYVAEAANLAPLASLSTGILLHFLALHCTATTAGKPPKLRYQTSTLGQERPLPAAMMPLCGPAWTRSARQEGGCCNQPRVPAWPSGLFSSSQSR